MEPVTKWSPKQVVDWTRGEWARGPVSSAPGMEQAGAGGELGNGVLSPSCRQEALRAQRGDHAHFFGVVCEPLALAPASRGVGCGKPGGALSLNSGLGLASPWRERVGGAGLGTRERGGGALPTLPGCGARCPGCRSWRAEEAQGAFVWVTPLGPHKCRLPRVVAGMTGRLDR